MPSSAPITSTAEPFVWTKKKVRQRRFKGRRSGQAGVGQPPHAAHRGRATRRSRNAGAQAGDPSAPADLTAHEAVIYAEKGGGPVLTFRRADAEVLVTLKGRLRVTAAEGVRAAVLANAGIAITSEWMFAREIGFCNAVAPRIKKR